MPPPIQNQSGSRAALVTWTVVSSILFVVATVLAIFSSVAANKAQTELATTQQKYQAVVSDVDLTGDVVTGLTAAKGSYTGNLLNFAVSQRDALARKLSGTGADIAVERADATLAKIKTNPSLKIGSDNLSAAAGALLGEVDARGNQLTQLTQGRDALAKKLAAYEADFRAQLAAKDADIAKAQQATQAAQAELAAYRTAKDSDIVGLQASMQETSDTATATVNQLTAQQQEAINQAKRKDDQIKALQNKLGGTRQPVDQIVAQADAHVMRVAGDGILYIDLGTGDQVSNGMSFEIYDRIQGIPKTGQPTNDEALPKGKASIEIIKVSPGSSACRIVRQTPGETVVEGDVCVNLVFDRNVKYNVMVYGVFDLDRNGQASPQDADVIKRLVTRWGGKVVTKLNADTDFLVVGKMPEVPSYSQEELDRPEIQFEVERKQKEVAEYDDLLGQAIQLNIPVLNQNRFLYFTGYYEQSAR
ncbi:MAG TPA: hypothetical protein VF595_09990 [Tepidisphaeraceae bacterium]|jgi:hypothetical protein